MAIELGLIISAVGFFVATMLCGMSVYRKVTLNTKLLFSVAIAAIVMQLFSARQSLYLQQDLQLSLVVVSLLISGAINIAITVRAMQQTNTMLLMVCYAFSGLLSLSLALIPTSSHAYLSASINTTPAMFIHIMLSMAAYCILIIASLYALQFRYINAKLKAKTLSLHSHLPSLNSVEAQQFRLMAIGLTLLTMALATGFAFLDGHWSKQYAHKTALSILAWVFFAVLTLGHKIYGWRGNKSAIGTIFAAFILTLAYFGSRFVREILLS